MNIRPIGSNEISFFTKRKVPKRAENENGTNMIYKPEKNENNTNMIYEPKDDNPLFPKKWTNVIIITKGNEDDEDGEETEGLGRE